MRACFTTTPLAATNFIDAVEVGGLDDLIIADSVIYSSSVPFGYQKYKLAVYGGNTLDTIGGIPNYNIIDTKGVTLYSTTPFREPFYKYKEQGIFQGL